MTTTRELCGALSAILRIPNVERHAARLVRDGLLPRSGEEVDEEDAARLILAVAAEPHPDQASEAIETLMSRKLMFLSRSVAPRVVIQGLDADRSLMPETVVDALAGALEFEIFGNIPGLQIDRLSVECGGLGATIDVLTHMPNELAAYCAQYGGIDPSPIGLRTYTVVSGTTLRAVAAILQPDQAQRRQQEFMSSLAIN